ncbi:hypothetical protein AGOR_G00131950 [Albula goreensis]|uniref:Uncharacterized protein n=1 Tax=Albula goreensis TaxID=1534307 RepID=A0A8T3D3X2_9TELE|nr:hypothetical protein AGOR_G00131950 [Albula goreensis]
MSEKTRKRKYIAQDTLEEIYVSIDDGNTGSGVENNHSGDEHFSFFGRDPVEDLNCQQILPGGNVAASKVSTNQQVLSTPSNSTVPPRWSPWKYPRQNVLGTMTSTEETSVCPAPSTDPWISVVNT